MSLKTTLERLEDVQTAITKVLSGQEYTIDGTTFKRPDLNALVNMEKYYERKYAKEQKTRPSVSYADMSGASSQ